MVPKGSKRNLSLEERLEMFLIKLPWLSFNGKMKPGDHHVKRVATDVNNTTVGLLDGFRQ
ncbi:hypothetical protein SADUNF_Sadunf03G0149400 [Salix dunnii]|uniref:Uncharacterized protein n=1 Tax=Salix dunnii TaxID=1413687 RepID=A0A835N4Y1_9ROSI|nr:hypothetical protein SADUNF_Sadunf03G0149400 [Salix dunnii]